jgi:hypothetical protein
MSTIYKWNDTEASITAGTVAADDSVLIYDLSAKTMKKASIGDINGNSPPIVIPDATTYAVLAANSGKVHIVPSLAANCTITLPAAVSGLNYEFWGGHNAADAEEWIFVPTAGFFIGGLLHADIGGTTAALYSNGSSNDVFTVVNPGGGTNVKFVSDGTNWYVNGTLSSADIGTMADS